MTVPTIAPDVLNYLLGVSAALDDLQPAERDELLEDLQGHLAELRAEDPDIDLVRRLGSPSAYADELRAAADLPVRRRSGRSLTDRVRPLPARVVQMVRGLPGGPAFLEFLPSLRPAWWVLRAVVLSQLLVATSLGGFHPASLIVSAVFAIASVKIGQRAQQGPLPRLPQLGLLALNATAAVMALTFYSSYPFDEENQRFVDVAACCGFVTDSQGNPVTNIYAYDAEGRPIDRVQLFDQNGRPLDITNGSGEEPVALQNVFPQKVTSEVYGADGTVTTVNEPRPPIAAPRLPLEPTASPTTSPSPNATASPVPRATPAGSPVPAPSR